jgi:hypothetical protein
MYFMVTMGYRYIQLLNQLYASQHVELLHASQLQKVAGSVAGELHQPYATLNESQGRTHLVSDSHQQIIQSWNVTA